MKNLKLFSSVLMVGMLLLVGGCQREEGIILSENTNFIKHEDSNQAQKSFFNRNNTVNKDNQIQNAKTSFRTVSNTQLTQAYTRFYNELARWDQEYGLVSKITQDVGVPFWNNSTVYASSSSNVVTFYLPLGFLDGSQTEALITGVETTTGTSKKYTFKLSERAEIQAAVDDPAVFSQYNNYGMELLHFIHNDFYTYGNPTQIFAKDFADKYNNGIDMQAARNNTLLFNNGNNLQTRTTCDCDVMEVELWVDEDGNIVGQFGDDANIQTETGNTGGTSGSGGNHDPGDGGSGSTRGDNPWNPNPSNGGSSGTGTGNGTGNGNGNGNDGTGNGGGISFDILCKILEFLFGIDCTENPLPGYAIKGNNTVESRSNTIITQVFIDCGQDGFSPDDLLVGSKKEGNTLTDLANSFNLDCDQLKCLNENPALFDRIQELKDNPPINACTGDAVDLSGPINGAVAKACETSRKYSLVEFDKKINAVLDGNPHIKISANLATDCPKLNCILNKLMQGDGTGSDFLCDLMSKFDGSPKFGIAAQFPSSSDNPEFAGKAEVINGNILISFNKNNCKNIEGFDLFETFQHELVHADFYRQLIKDYGWSGSPMTFDATFKLLVHNKYGPNATPDQHVLMLNQLLPDMINSLMQANGSNDTCTGLETSGPCLYFKTFIVNGFGLDLLESELGISLDLHNSNYQEYNLWKLSQPLYQNLNNCQ